MLTNEEFFNKTSSFYDEMINYEKAIERKQNVIKNFVTDEMKTAADIGCGTGVDSIVLSELGFNVIAFDLSEKMLEIAKINMEKYNSKINFIKSSATEIPDKFSNNFDFVVSLGNTFANISHKDIFNVIKIIYDILKENGKAVLQILNFTKILNENKRIINITENEEYIFVRFYDFHTSHINFNILKFAKNDLNERELITTKLYPHLKEDFEKNFNKMGLNNYNFYGNLKKTQFIKSESNDLVIEIIK